MHYLLLVAVVGLEMSPGLSFVDARDRSAIVSAIAYSVYDLLGEKVSVYVKEQSSITSTLVSHPQAKTHVADDDASVVRVSGFALH